MFMKKYLATLGVVLLATLSVALLACSSGEVPKKDNALDSRGYASTSRLVTTEWVSDNLDNKNVKIIDIRKPENYAEGHIPGALNLS